VTLRVAVDFGTSSTCVVASINGRDPQVVVVDGQPLMSSAVYAAADGTLFVGQEAERQAAVDPSRYEPNPKRRIDEGDLLLGDSVLRVTDVVHAVLRRAVTEARVLAGGAEVNLLVLTHPADWGAIRTRLLRQAAGRLALEVALVPEPVAAAVFHAATFAPSDVISERTVEFSGKPGETLAVLDLGGGTVDVSVVRRGANNGPERPNQPRRGGFQVLATRGDPSFGGADIDQALLEHVGSLVSSVDPEAWTQLVEGRELTDRRRRRVLRQDVRGAKETLSRHAYTDVPMPPPFADAHVTREDLERLITAPLGRAVELTRAAIDEAGLRPKQLSAIFLVGGSSRIPVISRLIHERTGVVPTTLDQPETVVARGALRAVLVDPDRTGALPGTSVARSGNAPAEQRTEVVRPVDASRPASGFATSRPAPPSGATFSPLNANRRAVGGSQVTPPQQVQGRGVPWQQESSAGQSSATVQLGTAQSGTAPGGTAPGGTPQPGAAPQKKGRRKLPWLIGGAVLLVAAVAGGLIIALSANGASPVEGRTFAQYDYFFTAPSDWTQTGDNVRDRQVVIRPGDALSGDDLVAVQEYSMDFDATVDRQRLVTSLKRSADADPMYSGFDPDVTFAGKHAIYYRQTKDAAMTDWYVLVQGRIRVPVACQYAAQALKARVLDACDQVVRTMKIGN
jgi:type VII secretion-associated protein (TIGR03931 family)